MLPSLNKVLLLYYYYYYYHDSERKQNTRHTLSHEPCKHSPKISSNNKGNNFPTSYNVHERITNNVDLLMILLVCDITWSKITLVFHFLNIFYFIWQSLLVRFKSFLLNRAVRSRPVKEMRWLTGIIGCTLMGMIRQSWLAVKLRLFFLLIK